MALGLKKRNKDADGAEEYPDGTEEVVEETLTNSSKKKDKDDDSVDYAMVVDWGRKYKPSMTFASKSIVEAKTTKVAKRVMKKVAISAAGIMLVLTGASFAASFFVNQGLVQQQEIGAKSKAEVTKLQPVAQYYDDFVQRQGAASSVLSKDIVWSKIQDRIKTSLPEGSDISNEQTRYGQVCASPTPFEPSSTIGCISLDVTVPSYTALGTLIDNLSKKGEAGVSDPYVTTTSNSDAGVVASVTFNFDSSVISTKYTDFVQEAKESGATAATPAAPATTPEAPATTETK